MTVFSVIFIINLAVLIGLTVFYVRKGQKKQAITNLFVLALFFLTQFTEIYYENIKALLYDIFGEDGFNILKEFLKAFLFFGSSITVGVQIISEIFELFVALYLALKVIKLFTKCGKSAFKQSIFSENEKVENKCDSSAPRYYLVLMKLLN